VHQASSRPRLRPVESIVVPDPEHGKLVVLRDTQGVTDARASLPPALVAIVGRFDGSLTCAEIAAEATRDLGEPVPVELVVKLANQLDRALFLEGKRFDDGVAAVARDFASAPVRAASHAGGAYHGDARELRAYLEGKCLGAASASVGEWESARERQGSLVALVAPHIDPWRGAVGYGHAYGALRQALAAQEVDTFILLGTSHAPMRRPFALCRKAFDTPLGALAPDLEAIDALAEASTFDAYADQLNHKREHSIEFQVVFLKHLLGHRQREREAKIVPVLAGLGDHQARRQDPAGDTAVEKFLEALRSIVDQRAGRAVVVAGADLAHVGPRFGDSRPGAAQLAALDATDRTSLQRAVAPSAPDFWAHVAGDLDTRRVCGLAPIYSLLRVLPRGARGDLLHYEQTVDAQDGSVVSHAALGYFA
jgi:AmmeMemoRadiSam system protein B